MSNRNLQRTIHAACRELGLDADARHDMQEAACGKASMTAMSENDLRLVINHLKIRGWKPSFRGAAKGRYRKAAPRADLRLIHVIWGRLGKAGCLKEPSRAGLNAFIRSQFETTWGAAPIDVDSLRDSKQINDVIQALVAWCKRAGVSLNK